MENVVFCSHTHATYLNQKTGGWEQAEPHQEQIELCACEHIEGESSREEKERGCHIFGENVRKCVSYNNGHAAKVRELSRFVKHWPPFSPLSLCGQFIKLASPWMVTACLDKTWCLCNCHVCSKGKCHITQMSTHNAQANPYTHKHTQSTADNESPIMRHSSPVRQALSGVEDFSILMWSTGHLALSELWESVSLSPAWYPMLFILYTWNWSQICGGITLIILLSIVSLVVRLVNFQNLALYSSLISSSHCNYTACTNNICFCHLGHAVYT